MSTDSVKATPRPWWIEERNGEFLIMAHHRGPDSKFCIAAINRWDDNAQATAKHIVDCVNAHEQVKA